MKQKGNEKYKDTIFRYLFSDEKNFVQLYYDITGKSIKPEELEFYDTESIVVRQLKNDVAFKTKDNRLIIMVEHQSTINENMPLRFLLYYAELLKIYVKQEDLNLFARKAIGIPKPEFFVVYNGKDKLNKSELFLKENLGGENEYINVKVKIMDINYDKLPEEIKQREDILDGYSYFMNRIRLHYKEHKLQLEDALEKAKEETLSRGYLEEYLDRKEFFIMITKVLSIEEEMELIRKEEQIEGRKEGRKEELVDTVIILLKNKFKLEIMPDEVVEKIKKAEIEQLKKITEDIFIIEEINEVLKYLLK